MSCIFVFFFFKQKTAYEMRISDWSSDVCSSDLRDIELTQASDVELTRYRRASVGFIFQFFNLVPSLTARENVALITAIARDPMTPEEALGRVGLSRSEERRVGKACVSTCRSRWAPHKYNKESDKKTHGPL